MGLGLVGEAVLRWQIKRTDKEFSGEKRSGAILMEILKRFGRYSKQDVRKCVQGGYYFL
jgi:hypothetical protein